MPDAERTACGPDDPDMYPSYPPLAGKHLRVSNVAGPPGGECIVSVAALGLTRLCCSQNILQIIVMKKEILYVHVESAQVKERMLRDFQECIDGRCCSSCVVHAPFWD